MTSESMESLREKIAFCKEKKSKLVISYHDIEDLESLLLLRDSGIDFICEDMPEANTETLGIMILIAGGGLTEKTSASVYYTPSCCMPKIRGEILDFQLGAGRIDIRKLVKERQ